jgi:hypothetical protein
MGKNKSKLLLLIFPVIILTIGVLFLFNGQEMEKVQAGAGNNVFGWAWSENIGWISFNSTNCDANGDGLSDGTPSGCPPAGTPMTDYGVHIDEGTGIFSGHAWSENIGWISFAPSGPYPAAPNFSARADLDGTVCGAPKQVCGWARALAPVGDPQAGGWDGWIKLDGSSYGYGVEINDVTHEFEGWAWGGDDGDDPNSTAVIGWISFNHLNCDANGDGFSDGTPSGCPPIGQAVADYKVETSFVFNNPPIATNLTVALLDPCIYSLPTKLSWSFSDPDGDARGAYWVQVDDNSDFSSLEINSDKVYSSSSEAYIASGLPYNNTYYWRLMVWDDKGGNSDWICPGGICPGSPFDTPSHAWPCPDFSWSPPSPSAGEITQFCAVWEPGVCLEDKSTCYNTSGAIPSPSCFDKSFLWSFSPDTVEYATGTSPTSKNPRVKFLTQDSYTATLEITDDLGTCPIDWPVNVTFPLPEWQEVAP